MKKKKMIGMAVSLVITAAMLTGIRSEAAYAVEGWTKAGSQWLYLDQKAAPVTDTWKKSRDDWFYLGSDGNMVLNRFVGSGENLYYVDENGRRALGSWVYNESEDGLGHPSGWYYFGSDGRAYHRMSSRFLFKVDNLLYAFGDDGRMLVGWLDRGGNPLDEDANPLEAGDYYSSADGVLKTDSWLLASSLGLWDTDGMSSVITGRDYSGYDELWLYFDKGGRKVRTANGQIKQKEIEGRTYGFDEYGIMMPWWSRVKTVRDGDKSNPGTDVAPRFYAGYDGGRLLKDQWFFAYPSEDLLEGDFSDREYSWWHSDDKGKVYQDAIRAIDGRHYAFDGLGRMQTGFVLFDGRSSFVAQYDPGTWSSDDFKYGNVYGDEKADLYFFSPDELNDGSMKTGDSIQIQLSDGVYTFGFGSNGVAYGNKNKTQKKNDRFYRGGLRLAADGEYGYGVVQVPVNGVGTSGGSGQRYEYRLVDTNGKIVDGRKKIRKDKAGGWILLINHRFAARVEDEDKPRWRDGPEGTGFYHYDRHDKGNPYGGFIAGYGDVLSRGFDEEPALGDLPSGERLNFGRE